MSHRDADAAQEFDRLPGGLLGRDGTVVADDLGDLGADAGERVERGRGFRNTIDAVRPRRPARSASVAPTATGATDDGVARGAGGALAAAPSRRARRSTCRSRLADEGERLTGPDPQRDLSYRGHFTRLRGEGDAQVLDPQDVGG